MSRPRGSVPAPRPHLDRTLLLLVAAGGAVGTAVRAAVGGAIPAGAGQSGQLPWGTLLVNVAGSFLLGLLLERLARAGIENRARQRVRLALGSGLLGGLTTFSALALELERLLGAGRGDLAGAYGFLSLALGLLACFAGIALAGRADGRRTA